MKKIWLFLFMLLVLAWGLYNSVNAALVDVGGWVLAQNNPDWSLTVQSNGVNVTIQPSDAQAIREAYATNQSDALNVVNTFTNSLANTIQTGNTSTLLWGIHSTAGHESTAQVSWNSVSFTCANGNAFTATLVDTGTSSTPPPPPPPAPAPPLCQGYKITDWSNCNVTGNWSVDWKIDCTQTPSYVKAPLGCIWSPWISVPSDRTYTAWIDLNSSHIMRSVYANHDDHTEIRIPVYVSTTWNKWVNWWSHGQVNNIINKTIFPTDLINNRWNALDFINATTNNIQKDNEWYFIKLLWITSRAPVKWSGKIEFTLWWILMEHKAIEYNFKRPYTGVISASNNNGVTWGWEVNIWTKLLYKLDALTATYFKEIVQPRFNNYSSAISAKWLWIIAKDSQIESNEVLTSTFSSRLEAKVSADELNTNPVLQINSPIINYELWGENISYHLFHDEDGTTPIYIQGGGFQGLKVEWLSQVNWNWNMTGTESLWNFFQRAEFRKDIRKQAYDIVKWLSHNQTIGGVRYVEWNIDISWSINGYETLIVKNGNVSITGNLNTDNKNFWIIVLKDNYNVESDFNKSWNIYVYPNVTEINGLFYADWWLISSSSNGTTYVSDWISRNAELNKQLIMNGSLFTRNTVWGAIEKINWYTLPGWSLTHNFDLAMIYDLNYLRRGNVWCDINWNNSCNDIWEEIQNFIIRYNPNIQNNPPKGFSK